MISLETNGLLEELDALIAAKHVLKHPFYQAWNRGELRLAALQDYATQYYHHVAAFPTYLSAVHCHTPFAEARKVILQNLIDEEAGSPNHPELWLQFAKGLGLSEAQVKEAFLALETADCVDTFYALCSEGVFTRGLAALYAYESQIPEVALTKIEGLKTYYGIQSPEALRYFVVHVEADKVHRQQERALLERYVKQAQGEAVLEAANCALEAVWNLLSGVCVRHGIACN